jgi:hypothetical protein
MFNGKILLTYLLEEGDLIVLWARNKNIRLKRVSVMS